jgi:NYN domain
MWDGVPSHQIAFLVACWDKAPSLIKAKFNQESRGFLFCPRGLWMAGSDKSALFIDGANLHYTARALGFEVDFRRLLAEFETECVLLRAYYYTTTDESTDLQSIRPLTDWLSYNGFHVKTKPRTMTGRGDEDLSATLALS